jgi:hypothetical protein
MLSSVNNLIIILVYLAILLKNAIAAISQILLFIQQNVKHSAQQIA